MSLTGNINFSGLLNGDVDCGQGSNVIPNPSGTATADLYKLQIDDTIYNIEGSGGTEVIPNPSGTATDDLTKIQIDDTIYQIEGEQGPAGYSPEVTIGTITGGHSVTITDEDHPSGQTFNVMDGTDGTDGTDGSSAYASVSKSGNTATIICTDANGTTTAQISDGTEGSQGPAGSDGTSAYATVSKSGDTATITCTDANGTTTAQISDGVQGPTGPQGPAGVGVPTGGALGTVLRKTSATNYDTYWDELTASDIPYDNTSSGMTATDTQSAITELKSNLTLNSWVEVTNETGVTWASGVSQNHLYYNQGLKLLLISAIAPSGLANQGTLVTVPYTFPNKMCISTDYDITKAMVVNFMCETSSGSNKIISSHSKSQPLGDAHFCYGVMIVE